MRRSLTVHADFAVPLESIVKPVIPQQTIEIIRAQKALKQGETSGTLENRSKDFAKEKMEDCAFYPFSFELVEKGRLELLATDYRALKVWVIGVSTITKNRKSAEGLAKKYFGILAN